MGRWSTGVWRRKVIKRYRRRAMKFREESKTPEEIIAWSKVIQWFDSILKNTIMNHNEAIALPLDMESDSTKFLEAEKQ